MNWPLPEDIVMPGEEKEKHVTETIYDSEDLESLPVRSVIIDADDALCRIERKEADPYRPLDGENLWSYGGGSLLRNHFMSMPVTVIHRPEPE